MSEKMTPMTFRELLTWLVAEHERHGSAFGVGECYKHASTRSLALFNERLETPFGPAAGPNTQLAQNIIAAYYAGARFFELKTVQKMDGEELAACISRPCILASDEGYNCEWSTELTVPQAFEEYVKAWFALKLISRKWALGSPDGFMFNMSVGYDLAGIKTEKLDRFIEGMKNAAGTAIWKECAAEAKRLFPEEEAYIDAISPAICSGVTVSTLHGCPPQEIEAIASYLISEKRLNTFVKCNPTILGYDFARSRLNAMGYCYIAFDEHHFNEDLQYSDAVPMFRRLMALARDNGLEFGLKLSNTFPVDVKAGELPSEEMYMSGRALYPLTIEMASRMAREFGGALRISYSGGADYFNMKPLFDAGIWPITVATTVLKPGGYGRFKQLAGLFENVEYKPFAGIDCNAVAALSEAAEHDARHIKPVKPLPSRKIAKTVPLMDCFTAPCANGCPIHQDIPEYIALVERGEYEAALELICEKNPLPFITGTICAHRCMDKCTRNFMDDSVDIRGQKLVAAKRGYAALMERLEPKPMDENAPRTAIVGAGPAGMAAAYFLAREGYPVTVFEREWQTGGLVRNVIPAFRILDEAIDCDAALVERMGGAFVTGGDAPGLDELRAQGFSYILLAFGAQKRGRLDIQGNVINVIDFLKLAKSEPQGLALGDAVAVVGGGNSAMDAARAAKRMGIKRVTIVYRRTKQYMPAEEEELRLALEDGVEFAELLSPVSQANGTLVCRRMALGEPDASGRRRPVETDEIVNVPADTVIAAVGEKPCPDAFARYGVKLNDKGRAAFDCGNGVFAAGDALRGPATVVEAIADARAFADVVINKERVYAIPEKAERDADMMRSRKARLAAICGHDCERCLGCDTVCESCVTVCPNRANAAIIVPGHKGTQILHIDRLCNECGNCAVFCPYESRPYRDKLTLFEDGQALADSENDGFYVIDAEKLRIKARIAGETAEYELSSDSCKLDAGLVRFIITVIRDYGYLI